MGLKRFLNDNKETAFSIEVLPPIRGKGIQGIFRNIDKLMEFSPAYINITTHRTEQVFREIENGIFTSDTVQKRPGSVAVASALKGRYKVTTVPHIICSGFTKQEIENQLIDLNYLGIEDILVLRGDRERGSNQFKAVAHGHLHASDLCRQVNAFNEGKMIDGTQTAPLAHKFCYGVAGYPEKHEEAMNIETDLAYLKEKVAQGASYIVTQMFFDNQKFFDFERRCRAIGIDVPIIPGIKPLTRLSQMSLLPKVFHIDFPEGLSKELINCRNDDEVKALGIEWGIGQARELKEHHVPSIHFYTVNATASVQQIAKRVF
ncbi:MAG: methylenetetrahydrofolate reductase [Prevotella sp.]|jgi:methylenetetrahydrofolate reductase (NADPH)